MSVPFILSYLYCICYSFFIFFFFFNDTATTEIYTLSLHDALPISSGVSFLIVLAPKDSQHRFHLLVDSHQEPNEVVDCPAIESRLPLPHRPMIGRADAVARRPNETRRPQARQLRRARIRARRSGRRPARHRRRRTRPPAAAARAGSRPGAGSRA